MFVVGATGNVGAETVRLLLANGTKTTACSRSRSSAEKLLGKHESLAFAELDLTQSVTVDRVFAGSRPTSLLLIRPPQLSDPAICNRLVDAAVAAGANHIVFLSVYGADKNRYIPHHGIEQHIFARSKEAGFAHTILRPSFFNQNLSGPNHVGAIQQRGMVDVPAGGGRTSFIDVRDIAAVAAECLIHPQRHAGQCYLLTGSKALTYNEVAAILSAVSKRTIKYNRSSWLGFAWRQWRLGTPLPFIGVMIAIYSTCWLGYAAGVSDDVTRILGRPPITFAQFAADSKASWAQQPPPPVKSA